MNAIAFAVAFCTNGLKEEAECKCHFAMKWLRGDKSVAASDIKLITLGASSSKGPSNQKWGKIFLKLI